MWDFLAEYGLFLAKAVTVVAAIVIVIVVALAAGMRNRVGDDGQIEVRKLNDRYKDMRDALRSQRLDEKAFKKALKAEKKAEKQKTKASPPSAVVSASSDATDGATPGAEEGTDIPSGEQVGTEAADASIEEGSATLDVHTTAPETIDAASLPGGKPCVYVVRFDGDVRASAAENLREEITAILSAAVPGDEVVAVVESGGGMVHAYGFAASQLARVREKQICLTVCVDKVAASGGYMMACVADRILAAPFAMLGSIGVVAQIPNFHRVLQKNDVDVEIMTAGEYKRTLTMFGRNTDQARDKFREELEDIHALFKGFVSQYRPALDITRVSTGEAWFGKQALELGLVDELRTSDDYLQAAAERAEILDVRYVERKKFPERLGLAAQVAIERGVQSALERISARENWFR